MVTPSPPPTGRQIAGLNFAAVLARRQEFPPPPDASSAANTKPLHPPSFSLSQMKKAALAPPNPSSFLAATRSSAPRVPRDLAFGVLYKDYICRESNPLMEEVSLSSGMRHVDQLRNHPLQQEEQVSYNIPQSMQRCLVTLPKNVLMLCGSGKGNRFTTSEIKSIDNMCKGIEESFYELDNFFKKLPADKKKLKGRDLKVSADGNDNDDKLHALASFRSSRDKFLSLYGGLVKFVDKKRSQVAEESRNIEVDPEAEMKLSAPLPLYLQTLVDKYCNDTNPKKMHSGAALDTVSRFSAFLASCVLNNVWCSTAETKCLRILVDASEDGSVREMSAAPPKLEAYWRHRIFNFLKTLRELKAVPKKDQLLADKWDWMSGGEKIACATSQAAKVEEK